MTQEIERKFIVNPQNDILKKLIQEHELTIEERHYLFKGSGIELRFTSLKKDNGNTDYTFDRMEVVDDSLTVRTKQRWNITKQEYDALLSLILVNEANAKPIIRHSYDVASNPKVQIKAYQDRFSGLVRAEVEFDSVEDSTNYQPPEWMGKEISNSPIGNDITLSNLTGDEVKDLVTNVLK